MHRRIFGGGRAATTFRLATAPAVFLLVVLLQGDELDFVGQPGRGGTFQVLNLVIQRHTGRLGWPRILMTAASLLIPRPLGPVQHVEHIERLEHVVGRLLRCGQCRQPR